MSLNLFAADDFPNRQHPAVVQSMFEAMEVHEKSKAERVPEGRMGRKIPVVSAIDMFRDRVARRPDDFRSLTVLGQLYVRMAKETGNHAAYRNAEKCLRGALAINKEYSSARSWLAVTLQAQHRFAEALELASEVYDAASRDTLALATIGDCQFHMGRVFAATATYEQLARQVGIRPAVLARQAQVAEVTGDTQSAIMLLEAALDAARQAGESDESVAWYELRLAGLHHVVGHADDARIHYRSAYDLNSNLTAAKSGMARLLAEHGDLELAIDLLKEVIDSTPSPTAMIVLGDVYTHQGRSDMASAVYGQAESVLLEEMRTGGVAHLRDLSRSYADRNSKVLEAVALAKQDLLTRSDIYAHDTLAWALHRSGRHTEAAALVKTALSLGTKDPMLHYHAGMIYAAAGQPKQAADELQTALRMNPRFDLLGSDGARQKLIELASLANTCP